MSNVSKIQTISRRFKILFLIIMVLTPVMTILFWGFFNGLPEVVRQSIFMDSGAGQMREISVAARCIGGAANMIPSLVASFGFYTLVRLFSLYEQGKVFFHENVVLYRRLGLVIILYMIAGVIGKSLTSAALTFDNPQGQRSLSIGISSSEIMTLVVGLMVMLIARIMDEARELYEEQQFTV